MAQSDHRSSEKSRQQNAKPQQSLKSGAIAILRELGIVLGAFLVLNSFVLASFEVPTGSMENEIMTGDFLLVNKFVFGGTTPRTVPFTNTRLPAFKLPAFWKVDRGDVIVFMFPGYRDQVQADVFQYYLKRCMAVAGDTLQIINRVVYVNGHPAPIPKNIAFDSPRSEPPDYSDSHIFPKGSRFNQDFYGPIVIPRKGQVIKLSGDNYEAWDTFIRREGHSAELLNGKVYVDGVETDQFTVGRDYVFGMGDHRDNSLDSRFWGFIPVDNVVGTPLVVYWSWDPNLALSDLAGKLATVRWGRFGTLVH